MYKHVRTNKQFKIGQELSIECYLGVLVHNASADCDYCGDKYKYVSTPPGGNNWTQYVKDKCDGKKAGPQTNVHGHHIVMKGKFKDLLKPVQNILCKYDIDPFIGCDNLVIARNWCHTKRYAERTVELITKADKLGKEAVLQALAQLTDEFTRCRFGDSEQDKMQMVSDKTDE